MNSAMKTCDRKFYLYQPFCVFIQFNVFALPKQDQEWGIVSGGEEE